MYQRWFEANKEREIARQQAYYHSNLAAIKIRFLKSYYANPEKYRKRALMWQKNNPEKKREFIRKWYEKNPKKPVLYSAKRRARQANGVVSPDIIQTLWNEQDGYCNYLACNADLIFVGYHLDHIMPLALNGKHEDGNLQLLCPKCNLSKGAKHPDDFLMELINVSESY